MTPAGQTQAAIDLLGAIAATARPADGTASEFFRGRRFIGAKDRRAVAGRVWGILRRWARLAWWVRRVADSTWSPGNPPEWDAITPRDRVIADLVLFESLSLPEIERLFDGEKFAPYRLTERDKVLVRALKGRPLTHDDMPEWVQGEVPEWVTEKLATLYGEHARDLLVALQAEAPVDLRVNRLKADLEHAVSELAAEEVTALPTVYSPLGLRLESRVNLPATKSFRAGLVEVQDEGSQLVALLADARPGMTVIDFCAGAGGKTLALAAQMENKGRLVASDVSAGRLERAQVRLRRGGVHNVTRRTLDGEGDKWVKRQAGSFDRVLVDAPCTGTGTWRRNPDAKWRLTEDTLADLVQTQAAILRRAARLVKPGGRLIYATCSLLVEENEAQIDSFLAESGDAYRILPVSGLWDDLMGHAPCPTEGSFLRLDPARHGTDGFFVAVLERAV